MPDLSHHMMKDTFEFPIVGANFVEDSQIGLLEVGSEVLLVPDLSNPADEWAVGVYFQKKKVGYVPNRGTSCTECVCPASECPYESHEPFHENLGQAWRLQAGSVLSGRYIAYVSRFSGTTPIVKVIVDNG